MRKTSGLKGLWAQGTGAQDTRRGGSSVYLSQEVGSALSNDTGLKALMVAP